jgi:hypothetical protein
MKKRKEGKLEAKYTVKACLSELGQIRAVYKKSLQGHKDEFRNTMQLTQGVIFRLRKNHTLRNDFKRSVLAERKKKGNASKSKFLLSLEAVAMATGATSRNSRQIASKRAKALDYLRTTGVKVADTARTIKSKGGVEKILAEIKQEQGAGEDNSFDRSLTNDKETKILDRSPTKDKETKILDRSLTNDKETKILVWMRMSDSDEIQEQRAGTEYTLSAICIRQKGCALKITKIKKAKGAADAPEASEGEWDE